ncbi:hypothetical protein [Ornithinimicrobium sp. INDO-MA30-4]|uniref:hypothetical protein n=1 Tax=Ornithinimicrobium sp. INDO-MA30-4 TaxID=2908651 RepID=UPI001F373EF1|nr:hypothetical protein [Ornithinimicrobium sp. INDO-MA30-4]UJH70420.1 hypothetical protein L0A91_15090 [Ornithinimicrobium sp. INDO-MA30-4]
MPIAIGIPLPGAATAVTVISLYAVVSLTRLAWPRVVVSDKGIRVSSSTHPKRIPWEHVDWVEVQTSRTPRGNMKAMRHLVIYLKNGEFVTSADSLAAELYSDQASRADRFSLNLEQRGLPVERRPVTSE